MMQDVLHVLLLLAWMGLRFLLLTAAVGLAIWLLSWTMG